MSELSGKIGHELFDNLIFTRCGATRKEVLNGPKFGVDVSVVDLQNGLAMAMCSDPLSLIPGLGLEESAWLSVHLTANDMATTGFAPQYGQFVLNLPATLSREDFKRYWEYIHVFCSKINLAITGGHTGFTENENSTIAGGVTFTTVAPKSQILTSDAAKPGNALLLTKGGAISSAAILAMSFPETVRQKAGNEVYRLACESFYTTSSLPDALAAVGADREHSGVTAMHDVTEGGVLGAVYELISASGNGVKIYEDAIPVGEVQQSVCDIFSLDPKRCIGAGAMLIACENDAAERVIQRLSQASLPCAKIGEVCFASEGMERIDKNGNSPLIYQEKDPYWAAFFSALKQGWK
jgi:hydrogenase expression/formation protein HypE